LGSNAWVVTGSKTTTGTPFLCNDMHLPLGLPSLWYLVHLVSGEYNVTGVSLPGLPMVLVGHNARIAWGATLAYTDCEDLFVEEFAPSDPRLYRFRDEWREAQIIPETIRVKGQVEPHVEQVVVTQHGPIVSDVVGYAARARRLAVNSMALRPCPSMQGWLALNKAGDWNEFVEAMRLIEAPQLNIAYADVQGNIGYWVTGKVPVRARGDGMTPAPGWTGEYEWTGVVPFEEMPHVLNPSQGYLVTCNHKIVPDDYPHFLGAVWMNGYRARRIVEVLESKSKFSPQDFAALHVDFSCIPGRELVERLASFTSGDPDVHLVLDHLRAWDGKLTADSVGGAVYEVARYHLVRNLLEPGLGKEMTTRYMGQSFHSLLMPAHEFYGHDTSVVLRLLDNPRSWWTEQAGGRGAVIAHSLKQAVEWLRAQLGPDASSWQWASCIAPAFRIRWGFKSRSTACSTAGRFPSAAMPTRLARRPSRLMIRMTTRPGRRRSGRSWTWAISLARSSSSRRGNRGNLAARTMTIWPSCGSRANTFPCFGRASKSRMRQKVD